MIQQLYVYSGKDKKNVTLLRAVCKKIGSNVANGRNMSVCQVNKRSAVAALGEFDVKA
jgi:hypothetical protein